MIESIDDLIKSNEPSLRHTSSMMIPSLESMGYFFMDDFSPDHFLAYKKAINAYLQLSIEDFKLCEPYLFSYYQDILARQHPNDTEYPRCHKPSDVWNHILLSDELYAGYRHEDDSVYICLSGGCDWCDHGLQIVFKGGETLTKVSPYDGHMTNQDTYDDPTMDTVIYKTLK